MEQYNTIPYMYSWTSYKKLDAIFNLDYISDPHSDASYFHIREFLSTSDSSEENILRHSASQYLRCLNMLNRYNVIKINDNKINNECKLPLNNIDFCDNDVINVTKRYYNFLKCNHKNNIKFSKHILNKFINEQKNCAKNGENISKHIAYLHIRSQYNALKPENIALSMISCFGLLVIVCGLIC